MTKVFEVRVNVDRVSPELAERVLDDLDGMTGHDHSSQSFVAVEWVASCYQEALEGLTEWLSKNQCCVLRVPLDLATRADIAERLDVTRQAVHLWTTGQRGTDFPSIANPVAGGVWLWGDVVEWAIRHHHLPDERPRHPSLDEVDEANFYLKERAQNRRNNHAFCVVIDVPAAPWANVPAPRELGTASHSTFTTNRGAYRASAGWISSSK